MSTPSKPSPGPLGLTATDRSLLLVTIIGTVVANLITVLVVGLAYLTARFLLATQKWQFVPLRDIPRWYRWAAYPPVWVWIPGGVLLFGLILVWQFTKPSPGTRRAFWISFAGGGLLVLGLGLIGFAAKVK